MTSLFDQLHLVPSVRLIESGDAAIRSGHSAGLQGNADPEFGLFVQ